MAYLHCTGKVLKILKPSFQPEEILKEGENETMLGSWIVNQITISRKKAYVFMDSKTFFSFILFGIGKKEVPFFKDLFLTGLRCALRSEGIEEALIEKATAELEDIKISKTNSRSLLGNLNDLCFNYTHHIQDREGPEFANIDQICKKVNRMPQRNLGWGFSYQALRIALGYDEKEVSNLVSKYLYGGPLDGEVIEVHRDNLKIKPRITLSKDGVEYVYALDDSHRFIWLPNPNDPKVQRGWFVCDDSGNVISEEPDVGKVSEKLDDLNDEPWKYE